MNLGIAAWVQIEDSGLKQDSGFSPARKYQELTLFGYCKLNESWQLAINEKIITYEVEC